MQSLRAFDAAGRHLNYSRAAEELGLTAGAVSHSIAKLEAALGARLFVRSGNSMILTNDGQVLLAGVRRGLNALQDALGDFTAHSSTGSGGRRRRGVTVSVLHGFADRWLLPRLPEFHRSHPDIDVSLRPTVELARMDGRDGVDIAIRYGQGRWGGTVSRELMPGRIFPVAAPEYLARVPVRTAEDLRSATLLRKPGQPWGPWLEAAGLDAMEPTAGPSFDDAGLVLEAAAQGQGIALAREPLVQRDLAGGRLVRVTDIVAHDLYSWYVVTRKHRGVSTDATEIFAQWLLSMAAEQVR